MWPVPPERAARPVAHVLGRARIPDTTASCVRGHEPRGAPRRRATFRQALQSAEKPQHVCGSAECPPGARLPIVGRKIECPKEESMSSAPYTSHHSEGASPLFAVVSLL